MKSTDKCEKCGKMFVPTLDHPFWKHGVCLACFEDLQSGPDLEFVEHLVTDT